MRSNRRNFLKGAGSALIAATSGIPTAKGGELLASGAPDIQPFVQIGRTRITGSRELAANGWEFKVAEEEYPGGKRYRLGIRNAAGKSQIIDFAGVVLPPLPKAEKREWRVFLD